MLKRAVTELEPDYIRALMDLSLNHNTGSTLMGLTGPMVFEGTLEVPKNLSE